jgi:hypothetical protein
LATSVHGFAISVSSAVSIDRERPRLATAFAVDPLGHPRGVAVYVAASEFDSPIQADADDSGSVSLGWVLGSFPNRQGAEQHIDLIPILLGRRQGASISAERRIGKKPGQSPAAAMQADFPATVAAASSRYDNSRNIAAGPGSDHGRIIAATVRRLIACDVALPSRSVIIAPVGSVKPFWIF